jgi:cytochrome bd-type quinol oxidase subunit 2
MYRTPLFIMVLLLAANPASADTSVKLTNAELRQLTSNMFFAAGNLTRFAVSYHVTWFPNGTREV